MARATYVLRNGELVEKHLAAPLHPSDAAPMIRPDGMDPIRSQADGRLYDSKSRYYADLKARGLEIVGNDKAPFERPPEYRPEGVREDMRASIEQLRSR